MRLCRQHRLYTALAFLFPRALLDHVAPVAELAVATARAAGHLQERDGDEAWSQSKALGFKLLVYLKTSFAGLTFPPGAFRVSFTTGSCCIPCLGLVTLTGQKTIWGLTLGFASAASASQPPRRDLSYTTPVDLYQPTMRLFCTDFGH